MIEAAAAIVTMDDAHALYMDAVRRNDHKINRKGVNRPLKPGTITEKQELYNRNLKASLGSRDIRTITSDDLVKIVQTIGKRATTQANRTGAELKVIFGWMLSLKARHHEFGLTTNPAANLGELWFAEAGRDRWLDEIELPIFLKALAREGLIYRRALLLFLLTGTRRNELLMAPATEYRADAGLWVIPGSRSKNHEEHPIALGPWGRTLMATDDQWIIQSRKLDRDGKITSMSAGWPKVLERLRLRMIEIGGATVEHFCLHDLRRTFRSHIDDLVDEALAERMMNHRLRGLIGRYNRNKRTAAMAAGFSLWDATLAQMARDADVGDQLGVPTLTTVAELQSTPQPQRV